MKCSVCSSEIASDANFCSKCGASSGSEDKSNQQGAKLTLTRMNEPSASGEAEGENAILWEARYSPKAMVSYWLFASVATVVGIAIPIFIGRPIAFLVSLAIVLLIWMWGGVQLLVLKLGQSYRLTSESFIHKRGILSQTTDRIEVIDMDDITYSQGIVERFLGVGTIKISSSDRTTPELRLLGVDNVEKIAALLDRVRRDQRRRRGVHIESI